MSDSKIEEVFGETKTTGLSVLTDEELIDKLISGEIRRNIILISDRKITEKEETLMIEMDFDPSRFDQKKHKRESIDTIGHGDIFIVEIDNPTFGGRSKAMEFLEASKRYFHDYIVVFLRTNGRIRKGNMGQFNSNFIIKSLPVKTEDREHYIRLLLVDKLPQVRGKLRQALHWATSKDNKKN